MPIGLLITCKFICGLPDTSLVNGSQSITYVPQSKRESGSAVISSLAPYSITTLNALLRGFLLSNRLRSNPCTLGAPLTVSWRLSSVVRAMNWELVTARWGHHDISHPQISSTAMSFCPLFSKNSQVEVMCVTPSQVNQISSSENPWYCWYHPHSKISHPFN